MHWSLMMGIPVGTGRNDLVKDIARQVSHVDLFNPCVAWPKHKKDGRVDALWARFKALWNLPDNDATKKWFNHTANARWKDFKSRVLKPHYDLSLDFETAIQNRLVGLISAPLWEELCHQFAAINDSGSDTKSKSDKCRDARKSIATDHHWGRTSISGWSHKHVQKFGKIPTVAAKFRKGYMSIDALMESETSTGEEGEGEEGESADDEGDGEQQQPVERGERPKLRAIAANLDKVYEECINDGSDESTANTIACEQVLGKTKRLGIGCSSSKKVGRSKLFVVRDDDEIQALKVESQALKDELKLKDDRMDALNNEVHEMKNNMQAMLEYFRSQGVVFPTNPPQPPTNTD